MIAFSRQKRPGAVDSRAGEAALVVIDRLQSIGGRIPFAATFRNALQGGRLEPLLRLHIHQGSGRSRLRPHSAAVQPIGPSPQETLRSW